MRNFADEQGGEWVATAHEEDTPRHHGRWYLVFHPAGAETPSLPVLDVRWQTRATAERTIRTMSEVELRRRLLGLKQRAGLAPSPAPAAAGGTPPDGPAGDARPSRSVNAG